MKAIAAPALMDHILRKYQRIAERIALSRNFQKGRMQTEPPIPLLICQEIWQNFLYRVEATETERKRKIIGEVTAEKVKIVQDADAIYREEIDKAGLAGEISQYYAALTNMQTVGVMGDFRTYDYAIALRAVITSDFMTATAAEIPWSVLQRVMTRIVNEVDHVNRVFYDLTSKPPGTVEME
jgi:GMP synthase (glutamine-hydrolysing) B subunit